MGKVRYLNDEIATSIKGGQNLTDIGEHMKGDK